MENLYCWRDGGIIRGRWVKDNVRFIYDKVRVEDLMIRIKFWKYFWRMLNVVRGIERELEREGVNFFGIIVVKEKFL